MVSSSRFIGPITTCLAAVSMVAACSTILGFEDLSAKRAVPGNDDGGGDSTTVASGPLEPPKNIIAGQSLLTTLAGSGEPRHADGRGTEASFSAPIGLAFDADENLYVASAQPF